MIRLAVLTVAALSAPALAQTSSCVRDAGGALNCTMSPAATMPNAARRATSTRDLSAAAIARGRAQAQAMRDSMDQQRRDADERAGQRRQLDCPGTPLPPSGSQPPHARACGY